MIIMLYPYGHREDVILDVEVFWNEDYDRKLAKSKWNLDLNAGFIATSLLKTFLFTEHKITFDKFEEFCKDMDEIEELRGWLWEKSGYNRQINPYELNAAVNSQIKHKVETYVTDKCKSFADKYGFAVRVD